MVLLVDHRDFEDFYKKFSFASSLGYTEHSLLAQYSEQHYLAGNQRQYGQIFWVSASTRAAR